MAASVTGVDATSPPTGRALLHALWRGGPGLPTTIAGAEMCVLVAFVGLRLTDVVQLLVATPVGLHRSTDSALDLALILGYLVESAVVITLVIRARRYFDARLATIDTAFALVVLLCEPLFTSTGDRVGTWTAWGFAVSVGTAFGAGIAYPRRWQTWTAATALAAAYLAVSLPGAGSATLSTVLSNTVGYFGFALFPRALATYLRRLGAAADQARADAAAAAQQAERDRQRWLLHDHATIMRMLADPELDPAVAELVRRQAAVGANRVRSFLGAGDATPADGSPTRLTAVLTAITAQHADLPIDSSVELATGVELDAATAAAVADAVTTLLHNVRRHARAASVVLHADRHDGVWEVSVADDGVGFDPDTAPLGFGLREQVTRQLAGHGVTTVIESAPGEGTRITLSGPVHD